MLGILVLFLMIGCALRFDPGLRGDPSESATATAVYSIYLTPGLGLPTPSR